MTRILGRAPLPVQFENWLWTQLLTIQKEGEPHSTVPAGNLTRFTSVSSLADSHHAYAHSGPGRSVRGAVLTQVGDRTRLAGCALTLLTPMYLLEQSGFASSCDPLHALNSPSFVLWQLAPDAVGPNSCTAARRLRNYACSAQFAVQAGILCPVSEIRLSACPSLVIEKCPKGSLLP